MLSAFIAIFGLLLEKVSFLAQLGNHVILLTDLCLKMLDLLAIVSVCLSRLTIGRDLGAEARAAVR